MTRSKGPAEEVSLPPTRMRKDVSTVNEGKDKAQGQVQANVQSQQRTTDTPSPFARPGSWAGTSTMPTSEAGVQPVPSNPFAQPDSHAGFVPPKPTSPHSSSLSPMSGHQFQEDVNTSVSWDLVDTDTDMEVANINSPSTHQTVTNKNCADSSNESQNNTVGFAKSLFFLCILPFLLFNLYKMLFALFAGSLVRVGSLRLFWGMVVRGCAHRDLC